MQYMLTKGPRYVLKKPLSNNLVTGVEKKSCACMKKYT